MASRGWAQTDLGFFAREVGTLLFKIYIKEREREKK